MPRNPQVRGSELIEYDPWEGFRRNWGSYRTVAQPYTALLNLAAKLEALAAISVRPTAASFDSELSGPQNEADENILEWCNEHGLLGLVPVLSDMIELPGVIELEDNGSPRVLNSVTYYREGGIWDSRLSMIVPGERNPIGVATARSWAQDHRGRVTWLDLDFYGRREEPLDHLRRYFTDSDNAGFRPDLPNGEQFWRRYCEPLDDFAHWASRIFRESVENLSRWQSDRVNDFDARLTAQRAHSKLNSLAAPAAPSFRFRPDTGRIDEERVSAGLLSSYALMVLLDREDGRRALKCNNCAAFFVSNESRAGYCSERCRNTASNRRYRTRKRNRSI